MKEYLIPSSFYENINWVNWDSINLNKKGSELFEEYLKKNNIRFTFENNVFSIKGEFIRCKSFSCREYQNYDYLIIKTLLI